MAVVYAPDSAFAKEMAKYEALPSAFGPGQRPYQKRDFPMMLHRAAVLPQGGIDIVEQQIVGSVREMGQYTPKGFRETPLDAIEALKAQQDEAAHLAAERAAELRRMSPKAQAEVAAKEEAAGAKHLPTIEETPIKRRGRPKKLVVVPEAS